MSDSDRDDSTSSFLDLGEALLNAVSDGQTGDRWRDAVEQHVGDGESIDYDALVAAGLAAGEQTSRMRQQSRRVNASAASRTDNTTDADHPLVDVRDVHAPDGSYAGTRVVVSSPSVDAYLAADGGSLVVRYGDRGEDVDLPTQAAGIEEPDTTGEQSVSEFVAYVDGSVLDPNHTEKTKQDDDHQQADGDEGDDG